MRNQERKGNYNGKNSFPFYCVMNHLNVLHSFYQKHQKMHHTFIPLS